MADITNKNELKRRIELFLDELDYSINEDFCKETMKMMREFIGHASHRLDCEGSRVKSLKSKLKNYKDLEEQGLLLRLPCKVGDTIYVNGILGVGEVEEYKVIRVDYHSNLATKRSEFYIEALLVSNPENSIGFYDKEIGKTVFLTQAEAERKLNEMESK